MSNHLKILAAIKQGELARELEKIERGIELIARLNSSSINFTKPYSYIFLRLDQLDDPIYVSPDNEHHPAKELIHAYIDVKDIFTTPLSRTSFPANLPEWKHLMSSNIYHALNVARRLAEKYQVDVGIVNTDAEYRSDEFIKKVVTEDRFFISAESPDLTAKTTAYLIEVLQAKQRLQIDLANTKRIEQSKEVNATLALKIEEVRNELLATNPKKKPALSHIAEILNDRHVNTPRGGDSQWYASTVKRILKKTDHDNSNQGPTR